MADSPLIIKSKEFALQIIKVCNYVKQTKIIGEKGLCREAKSVFVMRHLLCKPKTVAPNRLTWCISRCMV